MKMKPKKKSQYKKVEVEIKIGDRVLNQTHGEGVVIAFQQNEDAKKELDIFVVKLNDGGTRQFNRKQIYGPIKSFPTE